MIESETAPSLWLRRLQTRSALDRASCQAILDLPYSLRRLDRESYVLHEGELPPSCTFVVSGMTYRHKLTTAGERQIVGLDVPSDMISTAHLFLNETDHNIQALTPTVVADFPLRALQQLAFEHPAIGRALWVETMIGLSIAREWIMNTGRREAQQALAHLLCELALRLSCTERGTMRIFELPMTQTQLGDLLGMSLVHVNRTLMALTDMGLIERHRRVVSILDFGALQEVAGFSARYLHLGQHGRDRRTKERAS